MKEVMEMRKTIFVLSLIFLFLSANAFAANISMPVTKADTGAVVIVPINIDDATGVAGFQFTITYDVSVLNATGTVVGDITSGWMITRNMSDTGQIKVAGFDTSLNGLGSTSGSLVKLKFKVVGKSGNKSSLKFVDCKLSDTAGNKIPSTCNKGNVRIKGRKGKV
jgi:hypothetical protein